MTATAWHYRWSKAFKQYLARNRRKPAVRRLARYAQHIVRGYENSSNDFEHNGEHFLLEQVARHTPGRLILDVGANAGDWSAMARRLLPDAAIHCFEIAPATHDKLQKRFAGDRLVTVNGFGLGADEMPLTLNYYPDDDTLSGVVDYAHAGRCEQIQVNCRPGDDYLAAARQENATIDLLKIDVEGAEPYVLKGFRRTLEAGRVRALQLEYGRANILTNFLLRDIYPLLQEYGFVLGKLYPNYIAFKDYELGDEDFLGPNYVAVRRDEAALVRALSA